MKLYSKYYAFAILTVCTLFSQSGVELYNDSNFNGKSSNFELGEHSKIGSANDKASSIKIEKGYQVIIFSDGDFFDCKYLYFFSKLKISFFKLS